MSSLQSRNKAMLEVLFRMDNGYVLNFSNESFKTFMLLQSDIDVYDAPGYNQEESKAKKLRYFIQNESDEVVGKVLLALLDKRAQILEQSQEDDEYDTYARDIRLIANAMVSGAATPQSEEDYYNARLLQASRTLIDILSICGRLCLDPLYTYNMHENSINDYLRGNLISSGYAQTMDQTRHGLSAFGNSAGEVDILLKRGNDELALIEGLKLNSVNQQYIKDHINKATCNYNPLGTATYLVAYVKIANFESFWENIMQYLNIFEYPAPIEVKEGFKECTSPNAAIKYGVSILRNNGYNFPMYFIAVRLSH